MRRTVLFALILFCANLIFSQSQDGENADSKIPPRDQRPLYELPENGAGEANQNATEPATGQGAEEPQSAQKSQAAGESTAASSAAANSANSANSSNDYNGISVDNPAELGAKNSVLENGGDKEQGVHKFNLAGVSDVPSARRPKKPDGEKARLAAQKDDGDGEKKTRETIKYGIESELMDLVKKLIDNDDPRYSDELYDLFQETKSPAVREKILEYFTKLEDPCLEDYAVTILNDPYEEKNSTVEQCFKYISAVKTREAVPAVVSLLESEKEAYFNPALSALGEIGGETEAQYLVEFLDRSDLTSGQRQALMRVLGKLKAVETWDALVEIAEDEGENSFVRMYAAEAIGAMKKEESVGVLVKLFESTDANLRCYCIKGLAFFPENKEARNAIIQAIKDGQYKVRLEAITASGENKISDAVPYIIYRAQNDPEASVKSKAYETLAKFGSSQAEGFLIKQLEDKKAGDGVKRQCAETLLKYSTGGRTQIASLAEELAKDDRQKPFRYTIGKLLVRYPDKAFSNACRLFLESKDAATCAMGLDLFKAGEFNSLEGSVRKIAEDSKAGANKKKAMKILGIEEES